MNNKLGKSFTFFDDRIRKRYCIEVKGEKQTPRLRGVKVGRFDMKKRKGAFLGSSVLLLRGKLGNSEKSGGMDDWTPEGAVRDNFFY